MPRSGGPGGRDMGSKCCLTSHVQAGLGLRVLGPGAGGAEHVPRDGGPGGRWRAHREADAQGRQRVPQVQGQAQQLAQGAAQS